MQGLQLVCCTTNGLQGCDLLLGKGFTCQLGAELQRNADNARNSEGARAGVEDAGQNNEFLWLRCL